MRIAIVLVLFALTTVFDYKTILKHEGKRVKIIHFSIMLVSFCVRILYSLRIPVPSPTAPIEKIVEALFRLKG